VNFGPQTAMNDMDERLGIPNSQVCREGTGKPISATTRNIFVKLSTNV